jgi:hypothetical protein
MDSQLTELALPNVAVLTCGAPAARLRRASVAKGLCSAKTVGVVITTLAREAAPVELPSGSTPSWAASRQHGLVHAGLPYRSATRRSATGATELITSTQSSPV